MDEYPFHSEADEESDYECLDCGHIVTAESHPGDCTECGSGVQNRAVPLE